MDFIRLSFFLFVLAAFSMGLAVDSNKLDIDVVNSALNNASQTIGNITLEQNVSQFANGDGLLLVLEKYVQFIGTFFIEVFRTGVVFGSENPQFFTPEFLLGLMKLLLIAFVVSLLIKPVFYILIFIIMAGVWIKDKIVERRKKRKEKWLKKLKKGSEGA